MAQPVKKIVNNTHKPKKKETTKLARIKKIREKMKGDKEYGTSKLEKRFATNFLDRLGVRYEYQYKASSIGRFFDFCIWGNDDYPKLRCMVEIDGDYYHSYGLVYEQMNPMQKRNHRVDEIKTKWCSRNGVPLIRLWEHDINEHPEDVMKYLRSVLKEYFLPKKEKDTDKKKIKKNIKNS